MTIEVTRDYGNGIVATYKADEIKDVVRKMASGDEIFSDIECVAKVDDKWVKSSKTIFSYRKVGKYEYYEQNCIDTSPEGRGLKDFKRSLGQHLEGETLFVKSSCDKVDENENVIGGRGWHKFKGKQGAAS